MEPREWIIWRLRIIHEHGDTLLVQWGSSDLPRIYRTLFKGPWRFA